jgi:7-cyano-7-deazaguanine synthase
MKKIVMGLSGGMDSTTLLGLLLEQGYEVRCCTFYYGSKHNKWENRTAENVIDFYQGKGFPVTGHVFNLSETFRDFNSALLLTGEAIPEGHYEAESMRKTVVPGRNMIFASIMAGLAESIGAETIALGVHQGDHFIYPDCRKEFILSLNSSIFLSSNCKIEVISPLINLNKMTILKMGMKLKITPPYELTRTCYKDQELSCGKCGSCQERLEAFKNLNLIDLIKYE